MHYTLKSNLCTENGCAIIKNVGKENKGGIKKCQEK